MDATRMLREAERRLKGQKYQVIGLMLKGKDTPMTVEIVEIDQASGFVEVKTVMSKKMRHILIALDVIAAVNLMDWQPE
ncbi:hypothetical protein PXK56_18380 [Phaeobacter gallaeciensis]|uniref:hypothetical protein n=1 Tax=Phaeobacter gallaeciensis TaxID=60890 RepID=UPI0023807E48|nr:hypothetical protein [Phaeobacter gallaeciensis]MDE4297155.1 hypothetical protein [Phaeobacter gallaeciensis]